MISEANCRSLYRVLETINCLGHIIKCKPLFCMQLHYLQLTLLTEQFSNVTLNSISDCFFSIHISGKNSLKHKHTVCYIRKKYKTDIWIAFSVQIFNRNKICFNKNRLKTCDNCRLSPKGMNGKRLVHKTHLPKSYFYQYIILPKLL